MLYEYLLISVVIACGYWGWFFLRRRPPGGSPLYGAMHVAAAALSGLGLLGRAEVDSSILGLAGAIGAGAGLCLLVVGPLLRAAARRLAAAEYLGAAARLLDLAELLTPGAGVAEEKAMLGAMLEIRAGRVEHTVDALTEAKARAPAGGRAAIDERIVLLYVAAYRWADAIRHAETHLLPGAGTTAASASDEDPDAAGRAAAPSGEAGAGGAGAAAGGGAAEASDAAAGAAAGGGAAEASDAAGGAAAAGGEPALPRDLGGISPPVWVELVGAYARAGQLARAAAMLLQLEEAAIDRPGAALWLHRARLMVLALAGRVPAARGLVTGRAGRHMSVGARAYWLAVAHDRAGERASARAAYARARRQLRGRPREVIDAALAALSSEPAAPPVTLTSGERSLIERIEAAPALPPIAVSRAPQPWGTRVLTAITLAVAAATAIYVGPSAELGSLVRSGARVSSLVDAGEWWRLVSCVFVHIGAVHLVVNVIGLFFLGRLVEELFGTARLIAIFAGAGVTGAAASYAAAASGISAGASGAVFGLLGAIFIELTLHRARYAAAWRRGLWGAVVVVTLGQLAVGMLYSAVDHWAHGAGLLAGIALGAALPRHGRAVAVARHLARAIAVMSAAFGIAAGVLVARTSVDDSLRALPRASIALGRAAVEVPAAWSRSDSGVAEPAGLVELRADALPLGARARGEAQRQLAAWTAQWFATAELRDAPTATLVVPPGWEVREQVATLPIGGGDEQAILVASATRERAGQLVIAWIAVPASLAREAPETLGAMLGSATPR
jgi:rhomboid protease GluP